METGEMPRAISARALGVESFRDAFGLHGLDDRRMPVSRVGATWSSMTCMIEGTPAMTITLPIRKPGAFEIGFSTRSAPSGMRAMRILASFRSSGL